MAARKRRKKRFAIRFELGLGGLFGLGLVCFCVFLWMFLLGIWAGQTVLSPENGHAGATPSLSRMTADLWEQGKSSVSEALTPPDQPPAASPVSRDDAAAREAEPEIAEPSFFSLQVARFDDPERAEKAVADWRGRGYDAFRRGAEEEGGGERVFVGRFTELADANKLSAELERRERLKAYITLLPAEADGS